MAYQLSGRATVLCLSGMATLWLFMYSPFMARLWPILTGQCDPVPGPAMRGIDWLMFHSQLVQEVARADQKEVQLPLAHMNLPHMCRRPGNVCCAPSSHAAPLLPACEEHRLCACQGFDLIFYGDSITEDWRGTSGGFPWPIGAGTSDVFQKHFGQYRPEVLAIAGVTAPVTRHQCMHKTSQACM